MAVQVNPITQSLPATTAIQDPAVRQFANAVADALRAINSPEGSVKALVEALEAVGTGSQGSPVFGPNGPPQWVSEIYKSRLYAALKLPVSQIVRREGLGSDEALEVIEDNNTVIVNALNSMWATVGASGVFTEDGKNIVANWTTAQAEKWSQIEAEVLSAGGQTIRAALAEESDARATLEGQVSASWMVKAEVDVGTGKPYVAGIALGAEGQGGSATSEFLVRADRFAVVMPGYGEHIPFAIGAGNISFNGLTNWSNVQGKTGFASISQITPSNITTYIANAAIGNAQIDRASVNKLKVVTADIENAAITTLSIAGNAVTVPISVQYPSPATYSQSGAGISQIQTLMSASITVNVVSNAIVWLGTPSSVDVALETIVAGHSNYPIGTEVSYIGIYRNGSLLKKIARKVVGGSGDICSTSLGVAVTSYVDTISLVAGTNTVEIKAYYLLGDGTTHLKRLKDTYIILLGAQR